MGSLPNLPVLLLLLEALREAVALEPKLLQAVDEELEVVVRSNDRSL